MSDHKHEWRYSPIGPTPRDAFVCGACGVRAYAMPRETSDTCAEPGEPCPLCGETVKAGVKHYCPSGLSTPREQQARAMSFAWGNMAASTNHRPTEEVFRKLAADHYDWTDAEFDAWLARHKPAESSAQ